MNKKDRNMNNQSSNLLDIPKKYTLMCEKAPEIQKIWKPKDGDLFYHKARNAYYLSGIFHKSSILQTYANTGNLIWLPRQYQLQKMIIPNHAIAAKNLFDYGCKSQRKDMCATKDYFLQFTSMPQLWLAFVMFELYQKQWDEESWIKK